MNPEPLTNDMISPPLPRKSAWYWFTGLIMGLAAFGAAYVIDFYWEPERTILLPYLVAMLLCSRFRGWLSGLIVLFCSLLMSALRRELDAVANITFIITGLFGIYVGSGFLQESLAKREANRALARAQREQQLREQLIAALAHDLRNPLAAAKVASEVLLKHTDRPMETRIANSIIKNLDKIDERVTDLLDASRVASGEALAVKPVDCDICALVRETIQRMATIHGERFDFECPVNEMRGHVDAKALVRILENLLGNAVKYGEVSRKIMLLAIQSGNNIDLSVKNYGRPVEKGEELFELYSRKDLVSKPGWGIGLSVVKGLTLAHGGRVSVDTGPDWTRFTVTLPLTRTA